MYILQFATCTDGYGIVSAQHLPLNGRLPVWLAAAFGLLSLELFGEETKRGARRPAARRQYPGPASRTQEERHHNAWSVCISGYKKSFTPLCT